MHHNLSTTYNTNSNGVKLKQVINLYTVDLILLLLFVIFVDFALLMLLLTSFLNLFFLNNVEMCVCDKWSVYDFSMYINRLILLPFLRFLWLVVLFISNERREREMNNQNRNDKKKSWFSIILFFSFKFYTKNILCTIWYCNLFFSFSYMFVFSY